MNSALRSIVAGALAVGLWGCGSGISVKSDWDPRADFAGFHTFVVLEEATGGGGIDQLNQNRIKTSIGNTLQAKGMQQVQSADTADVAVGWQVTTDQRTTYRTVNTGWGGYGYGWGGWYGAGGMGTSTTTAQNYEVGTLVIALFDTKTKEMIFTGTGSKTLSGGNPSPEEIQKRIDEAVGKILADYPPGSN